MIRGFVTSLDPPSELSLTKGVVPNEELDSCSRELEWSASRLETAVSDREGLCGYIRHMRYLTTKCP